MTLIKDISAAVADGTLTEPWTCNDLLDHPVIKMHAENYINTYPSNMSITKNGQEAGNHVRKGNTPLFYRDTQNTNLTYRLIPEGINPPEYVGPGLMPKKPIGPVIIGQNSEKNNTKNRILYGPPGTGKTFNTVMEALKILGHDFEDLPEYLEQKIQFDEYKSQGQVEFVTFHQSFSYEDFVEGFRAETNDKGELSYAVKDGVFKKIAIEALYSKLSDDRKEYKDKKEFVLNHIKAGNSFSEKKGEPYILIIDEINRGNTSRIFGELITLIESTKRAGSNGLINEAMDAVLPYSQERFTVPDNLYIIGTMNTADRSLALIDTALRRRFDFIEMMPDLSLIAIKIGDIDIQKMLEIINDRIEALYDREHTIGHAFFMKLKDEPAIEKLASIFKNNILPLLEEYFFEDWEKISKVLGKSEIYAEKTFKNIGFEYSGKSYFRDDDKLKIAQTYINIYSNKTEITEQAESE